MLEAGRSLLFKAVLCEPFWQGVITERTEVVVAGPRKARVHGEQTLETAGDSGLSLRLLDHPLPLQGVDDTCAVSVPRQVLAGLKISSGSWVSIHHGSREHPAKVFAAEDLLPEESPFVVSVPPPLAFSIGAFAGDAVSITPHPDPPAVATEVFLARVM